VRNYAPPFVDLRGQTPHEGLAPAAAAADETPDIFHEIVHVAMLMAAGNLRMQVKPQPHRTAVAGVACGGHP